MKLEATRARKVDQLQRASSSLSKRWLVALSLSAPLLAGAATPGQYSLEAIGRLSCEDSVKRLEEGMAAKDGEAFFTAGKLYDEGACVSRDAAKAVELWRNALALGQTQAAASLAVNVGLGQGAAQDYAAAGALAKQAGVRMGAEADAADYSLGYAYTWWQLTQREFQYPQQLIASDVRGSAELRFEPKSGSWKLVSFRRSGNSGETEVGSRIDRSKSLVSQAVSEAARAAQDKLAKPDAARVDQLSYAGKLVVAPPGDASERAEDLQRFLRIQNVQELRQPTRMGGGG
ncbi:MAG TPA: hypothetical protein VFV25_07040 [Methylibium sp.]